MTLKWSKTMKNDRETYLFLLELFACPVLGNSGMLAVILVSDFYFMCSQLFVLGAVSV